MGETKFTKAVRADWDLWQDPGDRMEWLAKTLSITLDKIDRLTEQLLISESQNYCKICGNTLDGYKPKEVR